MFTRTLIVTAANDFTRQIHDRMPVLIEQQDHDAWLTGKAVAHARHGFGHESNPWQTKNSVWNGHYDCTCYSSAVRARAKTKGEVRLDHNPYC